MRDLWGVLPIPTRKHDVELTCTVCQGDTLKGWGFTAETFGWWKCELCQTTYNLVDTDGGLALNPLTEGERTALFLELYGSPWRQVESPPS